MSALLRRRFFNYNFYGGADQRIREIMGSRRLICFSEDVEIFGTFGVGRGFLKSACAMFLYWYPPNIGEALILRAAQQGYLELVETGESQKGKSFLEPFYLNPLMPLDFEGDLAFHWFEPSESAVKLALITNNCQDTELGFDLFRHWRPRWE
ncbi:MAG: hypothetical protein M1829_001271 [Trizodia sp. TS-e1964]|nr:MAG: hypothetical protein M1829_001271 [Trizodia sp. TS-e1964]